MQTNINISEATVRVRAWSHERGAKMHRVSVEDGVVRVWDDVAGHFTACHSISPTAQRRIIRKLAAAHA